MTAVAKPGETQSRVGQGRAAKSPQPARWGSEKSFTPGFTLAAHMGQGRNHIHTQLPK